MGSDINSIARLPGRREQITWAMRQVDSVIAVSRALSREVQALGTAPERIAVIPTGVDQIIFHPHDRMRGEFHAFVEKPTPGGGFTFGARGSGHDDFVCLALTAALADIAGDMRRSPLGGGRNQTGAPHESLG